MSKLERVWERMRALVPDTFHFGHIPQYDDLSRSFVEIVAHLPGIDGRRVTHFPPEVDDVVQARLDASEIHEIEAHRAAESLIEDDDALRELPPGASMANEIRNRWKRDSPRLTLCWAAAPVPCAGAT